MAPALGDTGSSGAYLPDAVVVAPRSSGCHCGLPVEEGDVAALECNRHVAGIQYLYCQRQACLASPPERRDERLDLLLFGHRTDCEKVLAHGKAIARGAFVNHDRGAYAALAQDQPDKPPSRERGD